MAVVGKLLNGLQEVLGLSFMSEQLGPLNVTDSLTEVGIVIVANQQAVMVQLDVTTNALDTFEIHASASPKGAFQKLFSTSSEFLYPVRPMIGCSGDLVNQGVGSGWFLLDVRGLYALQIKAASSNAGGSGITAIIGGN